MQSDRTGPRSTQRYRPKPSEHELRLRARIVELAGEHRRYGHRRIHALLVREGRHVNRKAVLRIWREEASTP